MPGQFFREQEGTAAEFEDDVSARVMPSNSVWHDGQSGGAMSVYPRFSPLLFCVFSFSLFSYCHHQLTCLCGYTLRYQS